MVKSPVRIGVLGTHSTGKTTLMKRIQMELRGHGLNVARTGRLAKRAAAIGLPKMEHHTALSTQWIIAQGIADEAAAIAAGAEVVLAGRASVDAVHYYTAAVEFRKEKEHNPEERQQLWSLASTQLAYYDLLFVTVLDFDVPVEQCHDYDPAYRFLVDLHTQRSIVDNDLPVCCVTSSEDSKDKAVQLAVEFVLEARNA